MAAEISITRRDAYLFVHVQGDPMTPDERESAVVRMLGEAAEAKLDIVIHEDTQGVQPPTPLHYIGQANFLGASKFRKRIAYVPPAGMPRDNREFVVNAARNAGHEVKLFTRLEDATKWIEGHEDDTV